MNGISLEKLRNRVSESLNQRINDVIKTAESVNVNFENLGLRIEVWCSDKIHTGNLGGIEADIYLGYAQVDGKWGLIIETIERDTEKRSYIGRRRCALYSCGNATIMTKALDKIPDLVWQIHSVTEDQITSCVRQPDVEDFKSKSYLFQKP